MQRPVDAEGLLLQCPARLVGGGGEAHQGVSTLLGVLGLLRTAAYSEPGLCVELAAGLDERRQSMVATAGAWRSRLCLATASGADGGVDVRVSGFNYADASLEGRARDVVTAFANAACHLVEASNSPQAGDVCRLYEGAVLCGDNATELLPRGARVADARLYTACGTATLPLCARQPPAGWWPCTLLALSRCARWALVHVPARDTFACAPDHDAACASCRLPRCDGGGRCAPAHRAWTAVLNVRTPFAPVVVSTLADADTLACGAPIDSAAERAWRFVGSTEGDDDDGALPGWRRSVRALTAVDGHGAATARFEDWECVPAGVPPALLQRYKALVAHRERREPLRAVLDHDGVLHRVGRAPTSEWQWYALQQLPIGASFVFSALEIAYALYEITVNTQQLIKAVAPFARRAGVQRMYSRKEARRARALKKLMAKCSRDPRQSGCRAEGALAWEAFSLFKASELRQLDPTLLAVVWRDGMLTTLQEAALQAEGYNRERLRAILAKAAAEGSPYLQMRPLPGAQEAADAARGTQAPTGEAVGAHPARRDVQDARAYLMLLLGEQEAVGFVFVPVVVGIATGLLSVSAAVIGLAAAATPGIMAGWQPGAGGFGDRLRSTSRSARVGLQTTFGRLLRLGKSKEEVQAEITRNTLAKAYENPRKGMRLIQELSAKELLTMEKIARQEYGKRLLAGTANGEKYVSPLEALIINGVLTHQQVAAMRGQPGFDPRWITGIYDIGTLMKMQTMSNDELYEYVEDKHRNVLLQQMLDKSILTQRQANALVERYGMDDKRFTLNGTRYKQRLSKTGAELTPEMPAVNVDPAERQRVAASAILAVRERRVPPELLLSLPNSLLQFLVNSTALSLSQAKYVLYGNSGAKRDGPAPPQRKPYSTVDAKTRASLMPKGDAKLRALAKQPAAYTPPAERVLAANRARISLELKNTAYAKKKALKEAPDYRAMGPMNALELRDLRTLAAWGKPPPSPSSQ